MPPYEEEQLIKSNQAYNRGGLGGTYMGMQSKGGAGALNTLLSNSEWGQSILDPIDLFGSRAALAQENQDIIARNAAGKSINALRDQYYKTQELQQPFSDLGTQALEGFGQYEQGSTFQPQLREGAQSIGGGAAASGLYNSSATGGGIADFVNQLTNEDMNRQYQQQLNQVKIGQGAVGQIGAAGQNFGQAAGSVYGNQGNAMAQNALNYGQQRQQSLNTAGQAVSSLGNYLGSR